MRRIFKRRSSEMAALFAAAIWAASHLSLPAQPANDAFANAITLSGLPAQAFGSNVGATKQAGEPNHAGNTGGRSAWWHWTSPVSGKVFMDTSGSGFDTLLAVYGGNSIASLIVVASNDDDQFFPVFETSRVWFEAALGTNYHIAVDGYSGDSGPIQFHVNEPSRPINDSFAQRLLLTGTNIQTSGTNVDATREAGEPAHDGQPGSRSVWWRWFAPSNGIVEVTTVATDFDTTLAVYEGNAINALTLVISNDQSPLGGNTSAVTFEAMAGHDYAIAVEGVSSEEGEINLTLELLPRPNLSIQPDSAGGPLRLCLNGVVGRSYLIESAPTLGHQAIWSPVLTNLNLVGNTWCITNPPSANPLRQFYRAVLIP